MSALWPGWYAAASWWQSLAGGVTAGAGSKLSCAGIRRVCDWLHRLAHRQVTVSSQEAITRVYIDYTSIYIDHTSISQRGLCPQPVLGSTKVQHVSKLWTLQSFQTVLEEFKKKKKSEAFFVKIMFCDNWTFVFFLRFFAYWKGNSWDINLKF